MSQSRRVNIHVVKLNLYALSAGMCLRTTFLFTNVVSFINFCSPVCKIARIQCLLWNPVSIYYKELTFMWSSQFKLPGICNKGKNTRCIKRLSLFSVCHMKNRHVSYQHISQSLRGWGGITSTSTIYWEWRYTPTFPHVQPHKFMRNWQKGWFTEFTHPNENQGMLTQNIFSEYKTSQGSKDWYCFC